VTRPAPAPVSKCERRAQVSRAIARIFASHDLTAARAAALAGVTHQHVSEWVDPDRSRSMPLADATALPLEVRRDLAEYVAGAGNVVVEVPGAGARLDLEHAVVVQKETGDVLACHLRALADGTITRSEAVRLRSEIREAMRALASLDIACERAEKDGVTSTRTLEIARAR
jgi:hypothetical protein